MQIGIICLVLAYVMSQYFRAVLAVLAPALQADLGAGPQILSQASGTWFLVFAVMQIPVGWALDTIGPRKTASVLMGLGCGLGAAVFALAQTPAHVVLAMGLIGVGCAPVLMASYFIFARTYSATMFATLAGVTIGVGSFGNIIASLPTTLAVEAVGWRVTLWALGAIACVIATLLWVTVKDPEKAENTTKGSVLDLLKMPALWFIFPAMLVNYAPAAGLRGLWIGPFFSDVYGASEAMVGTATLVMASAMIAASFLYAPMDRIFGTRKWVIFCGNGMGVGAAILLYLTAGTSLWGNIILFSLIGMAGSSFPVIVAHARSFFPQHLVGRGVTLVNLFGIGGAGLMQYLSGPVFTAASRNNDPATAYGLLVLFFGGAVAVGLTIYLFSQDRTD